MRGQELVKSAVTPDRMTMEEIELSKIYYDKRLTESDREWVEQHMELAGKSKPPVDLSWLGFTRGY